MRSILTRRGTGGASKIVPLPPSSLSDGGSPHPAEQGRCPRWVKSVAWLRAGQFRSNSNSGHIAAPQQLALCANRRHQVEMKEAAN
jgi:hypothetical protein